MSFKISQSHPTLETTFIFPIVSSPPLNLLTSKREASVVRHLSTLFYIDDGLFIIAATVPHVAHTHHTLSITNA